MTSIKNESEETQYGNPPKRVKQMQDQACQVDGIPGAGGCTVHVVVKLSHSFSLS